MKVTALAGGVGGAKLLVGLQRVLPARALAAVVNVGDDAVVYGVHVAPDLDIVTYWLAGIADTVRGWGLRNDSFTVVDALARLGGESWFRLGDRDLATCIRRTELLRAGATLSAATEEIRRALGVATRILPASDDRLRTTIECTDGRVLGFQEYFVRERTVPEVAAVRFAGIELAAPAPGVLEAISDADRVVLCPSNPVLSIAPILALPGVRAALRDHPEVVAVTPIVAGRALKGPADRLLRSMFGESRAVAVARLYRDFCNVFVLDRADRTERAAVEALGLAAVELDTIMSDPTGSVRLASEVVAL